MAAKIRDRSDNFPARDYSSPLYIQFIPRRDCVWLIEVTAHSGEKRSNQEQPDHHSDISCIGGLSRYEHVS